MATFESVYDTAIAGLHSAVAALPSVEQIRALPDPDYLTAQREIAAARRALDAHAALLAGEGAYRSRPSLGYSGLAAREGHRSPEALVQATTGLSSRDTATLVKIGALMTDDTADESTGEVTSQWPWLAGVASAVAAGTLSPQQADAIRVGLGHPVETDGRTVTVDQLASAALSLVATCANPDQLLKLARALRDQFDAAGVVEREKAIHAERSFRRVMRSNGVPRYIFDPDLETAAFVDDLVDKLMSPRRNGPRFVDPADKAWAAEVSEDPRTPEQYLHDAFAGLITAAATSKDNQRIVGSRQPSVRVLVTRTALESGAGVGGGGRAGNGAGSRVGSGVGCGVGHIEGHDLPISLATVERIACAEGTIEIGFTERGQVLDLGRERRLFTPAQKLALAVRDGGCLHCGAPPSMTEAHHITPYSQGGRTDIADGVLLCRFAHMLLHNNRWRITRDDDGYWFVPPPDVDAAQTPRRLTSKSAALSDLLRSNTSSREQSA